MKKTVVTLAALLALGLVACSPEDTTSSSSPEGSPSESTTVEDGYTAVTITNKAELQETWYVETGLSRTVGISTTPAANNFTLMQSGAMTITSSDPTVIGVTGFNITALKAGTATITVTLTNDDDTKVTDSVEITVENRPDLSVGPVAVSEITEGEFYLGWFNNSKSTYSFITGEMSGFYGAAVDGSTQAGKAAKVKIAKSGEGYTFQIITEGLSTTNQYIGADSNTNEKGTHYNFVFVEEAFVWTYDATNGVFKATVTTDENEQVEVFLGSEGNYGTASCYPMDEIGDDGIYKMTPYTFNEGYALAGKPESGKAYKLGAAVKGDPNAIQAITGDMAATYYFGTTADPEIAIDVTVTEAENGWTLAPEGKGYIGATVSGTHTNIVYQEDPYYWTWNDELATFTTELTVGDATEVVAPGMEGTHDTIGVYDISNLDGINVASIYNAYYIATEEEVMTEGPIWTAPEDGVAMKFGAYNDSVANEGYWMINGEMDGEYFKTIETSKKDAWSEAVDVTPHKVTDGWTLQLASGKYIGAKAIPHDEVDEEGNPDRWYTYRPEYTDTAFVWQYEEDTKAFVTTISGLNTEVVESGSIKLFLGGQSKFTTGSVSDYKYVGSNLKMGFFTWGEYDLEEPLPNPVKTTINAILDGTTSDGNTIYQITGILEDLDHTDKYGNAYLTDPTTKKSVKVYGISGTMDAFTMEGGSLKYDNSKDAVTALANVENGMEVTLNVQWNATFKNVSAVYVSSKASTATYGVTVNPTQNGNANVSATGNVAYGTEVTITTAPATGYVVDAVKLTTAYGETYLEATAENTYKFNATVVNEVTVTFRDPNAKLEKLELKADQLGLAGSYGNGSATISEYDFSYIELMKGKDAIQMRAKDEKYSTLWNTTALPEIESIEFRYDTTQDNNSKAELSVTFGTEVITTNGTDVDVQYASGDTVDTVNCDVDGATFFRINRTTKSGALYFSSIVINFVA